MSSADTKIGAAAEARERARARQIAESMAKEVFGFDWSNLSAQEREDVRADWEKKLTEFLRSTPAEAGQPALRSSSPAPEPTEEQWIAAIKKACDYGFDSSALVYMQNRPELREIFRNLRSAPTVSAPAPTPEAEMSGAEKEAWNRRGPNSLMFEVWRFGRHYPETPQPNGDGMCSDPDNCNDPSHYFYEVLKGK